VLSLAGIDPKFTSHSFRHAATSRAAARGVSCDIIFSGAG
jgi:integrase